MTQDQQIQAALAILESRLRKPSRALKSPQDARNFAILQLAERKAEVFAVMFLDTRHRLIEWREMFFGTIDGATVYAREVVRAVLEVNAAAVIFVHNHPSGDPSPSPQDVAVTEALIQAGEVLEIPVNDHIIVGQGSYVSMYREGLAFRRNGRRR